MLSVILRIAYITRVWFLCEFLWRCGVYAICYGIDAFPLSSKVLSMISLLFLLENTILPTAPFCFMACPIVSKVLPMTTQNKS